jgi:hypothetical protein
VAVPNPEHLLERAEASLTPRPDGTVRPTDIRRAISDSYYAAFHTILIAAADAVIRPRRRESGSYSLAYRSLDHRTLRDLCITAQQSTPSRKFQPHIPEGGFCPAIRSAARDFLFLQSQRNTADYDPNFEPTPVDAGSAVETARDALAGWHAAPATERETFLHLLLFPPR